MNSNREGKKNTKHYYIELYYFMCFLIFNK